MGVAPAPMLFVCFSVCPRVGVLWSCVLVCRPRSSLASKLQSLSQEFRATQKSYLSQLKHFKEGSSLDDLLGASGGPAASSLTRDVDTGFTDLQTQHMLSMEEMAQERDEEIRKIVHSVEELVRRGDGVGTCFLLVTSPCLSPFPLPRRYYSKSWQPW